jgi:hypothetical protein
MPSEIRPIIGIGTKCFGWLVGNSTRLKKLRLVWITVNPGSEPRMITGLPLFASYQSVGSLLEISP